MKAVFEDRQQVNLFELVSDCEGKIQKKNIQTEDSLWMNHSFHEPLGESGIFQGSSIPGRELFLYMYIYIVF